jgi:hypothetical protein
MILPTKGVEPRKALLSIGAMALCYLDEPKTVSRLWNDIRGDTSDPTTITFDWFILALDLLYAINAIEQSDNLLNRCVIKEKELP